jgi:hypothetical protein
MTAFRSVNSGNGPMHMGVQGETSMVEPGNDPSDDDATKPLPEQPDAAGGAPTEPIAPHVPIADLGPTGPVGVPSPDGSTTARSRRPIAPWLLGGLVAVLLVVLAFAIVPGLLNGGGVVTGPSVSPSASQTPSSVPSTAPSAAPPVKAPSATPAASDPGTGGGSGPQPTPSPPTVPTTAPVPGPTVSVGP